MRSVAVVVASLLVLAVAPAARAADWVGLGDSFAAGPLIPNQSLSPLGCLRSTATTPASPSPPRARRCADVSCSGAKTDAHDRLRRAPTPAPTRRSSTRSSRGDQGRLAADRRQRHRLHRDPPELRDREPVRHAVPGPLRATARRRDPRPDRGDGAEGRGGDPGHPRSARRRAVLVVNYAAILPTSGTGCWPQVPIAWADVPYLRGIQIALNAMLAQQARRATARRSSTPTRPSSARTRASRAGTRWVEPLVPGNAAAPFHPNARGMAGVGGAGHGRGRLARCLSLDAAARTSLRAAFAPSASQRTHFWPSAVQTRPKCMWLAVDRALGADQPGAVGALGVGDRHVAAPSVTPCVWSARTPPASSIVANAICGSRWNAGTGGRPPGARSTRSESVSTVVPAASEIAISTATGGERLGDRRRRRRRSGRCAVPAR